MSAHQFTRRVVGIGVHGGIVDGLALCRMFNQATRGQPMPKYLSTDNDPLYRFHQWKANLRILNVTEIKTVPYTPVSHPFVERLIGTMEREFVQQGNLVSGIEAQQRRIDAWLDEYHNFRPHQSLGYLTPNEYYLKVVGQKIKV